LMSPLHFLERPLRWLQAITRYRATTSGGPGFAHDPFGRKGPPAERPSLDLRGWGLAFTCAQHLPAATLERLADAVAGAGFRREAFYCCYGLAEGTLIASGGKKAAAPVVHSYRLDDLANNSATAAEGSPPEETRALVSSGRSLPDQRIVVVD